MAELAVFMISESTQSASTPNGMIQQLISPTIALRPKFIPATYSFAITIGLRGVDISSSNCLQIQILSPDNIVDHDSGPIMLPADNSDHTMPVTEQGFVISMDMRNFPFKTDGCYRIRICLNGETVSEQKLPVYQKD